MDGWAGAVGRFEQFYLEVCLHDLIWREGRMIFVLVVPFSLVLGSLRLKHRTTFSRMNIPDSLQGLSLLRMATESDPGLAFGQQVVAPGPYQRRESPTGLLCPGP